MQSSASGDKATGSPAPAAAPREPWESAWVWGFVVLVGVAVLCRQYFGAISYWYDEAFVLFNVYRRPFLALVGAIDCSQAAPVLYLWIERAVYLLLGPSELAMRLPAFLAGLAALLLMVPLARRLVGGPGWPWAVAFCALSAHFVMHSCEVHPYSFDVLACEAVLMTVCFYVTPGDPRRTRAVAAAPLFLAALVLPWFSFPAAFALGAAGLALLTHALWRRSPRDLVVCALFTGLTILSGAAMWYCHARYLNYPGLHEFWTAGFPRRYAPASLLFWTLNTPVEIGNYANQAVGIPLALLGVVGAWTLARRSPPLAVAAVGPIVLGMAAAFLHRYPMDDRLLLYAAPCLWLLGAAGVGAVLERFQGRRRWVAAACFGLLLTNGALETAKEIATVRSARRLARGVHLCAGAQGPRGYGVGRFPAGLRGLLRRPGRLRGRRECRGHGAAGPPEARVGRDRGRARRDAGAGREARKTGVRADGLPRRGPDRRIPLHSAPGRRGPGRNDETSHNIP